MGSSDHIKEHDGVFHVSPTIAGIMCDANPVTLMNWRKQPNAPPFNDGIKMYPVDKLGQWIRQEMIFKPGRGGGYPYLPDLTRLPGRGSMPTKVTGRQGQLGDKNEAETRLKTLQADKLEIELKQMSKELIPVDIVSDALIKMVLRVKSRLLQIPSTVAPLVVNNPDVYAIQKLIEDGVREALEELSGDWQDAINTEIANDEQAG